MGKFYVFGLGIDGGVMSMLQQVPGDGALQHGADPGAYFQDAQRLIFPALRKGLRQAFPDITVQSAVVNAFLSRKVTDEGIFEGHHLTNFWEDFIISRKALMRLVVSSQVG